MKTILFILIMVFIGLGLFAQVAINTDGSDPDASAILDVKSTTGGLLIPRMTEQQIVNIVNPAQGLLVYDISNKYLIYYDNGKWNKLREIEKFSFVADDDEDTRIMVEELADEDIIHYYTNGVEYFSMENGRFEIKNTGQSVFIGEYAGTLDDLSNNNNVFIGYAAGYANNTGNQNVGVGHSALFFNKEGFGNTATGYNSLRSNTSGNYNTSTGAFALLSHKINNNNTAVGYGTMQSDTSGTNNSALGSMASHQNINGDNNTAIGTNALYSNNGADGNTAVGHNSLYNNTGSRNTSVGTLSLYSTTDGHRNTAIGFRSGYQNTTGSYNTSIGDSSLHNNQTGFLNTAIGHAALYGNQTGWNNVAIGNNALKLNNGSKNTAIGQKAGYKNTGSGNIFIGNNAGYNETSSNKLYVSNTDTIKPLVYGDFDNDLLRINGKFQIGDPSIDYSKGYSFPEEGSVYNNILVLDAMNSKLEWKENKPVQMSDADDDTYISTDPTIATDKDEIWMYAGGVKVASFDSAGLIMMKHNKVHYKSYPVSDFVPTNVEYDYYPNPIGCDGVGADTTYDMPWDYFIKDNLYLFLRPGPIIGNTDVLTALDLPHGARLDSLGITIIDDINYGIPVCFKVIKTNIKTGQQQTVVDGFVSSLSPGSNNFHYGSVGSSEIINNQRYYYSIVVTTYFANSASIYLVGAYVKYTTTEF